MLKIKLEKHYILKFAILFDKDEKTIRKHINNIFIDEELSRVNNTQKMRVVGVKQSQ